MPETNKQHRERVFRHRGRSSQIPIFLGKQLRFFINESDWKVLPMAAVIAGLVSMVIRNKLFINMEGTLMGAFALTCVAIWNGCFNSIQSVCRERAIIKREHRSGMHISSYVTAHMIYQLLLCLMQTAVSMYVMKLVGVQFPEQGFMTPWMIVDIGITMFLISYAADMMSLLISSVSRTTTSAMTIMPFILIFQLVFSGGIIPLPAWSRPLSNFTISSYGIRAIAAQAGYNELPMVTAWNTLSGMRNSEIEETVTVGRLLEILDSEPVAKHRGETLIPSVTVGEAAEYLNVKLGDSADANEVLNDPVTIGDFLDFAENSETLRDNREREITLKATVGEVIDLFGEDNVREIIQKKTAEAACKAEYERSAGNIVKNWLMLFAFIVAFAALATIVLELIDKDKR